MNSIDDDAKLIGIDEKVWQEFKKQTGHVEQPYLPGFLEAEAEARESAIDRETFKRRKDALAHRWFGYYRKCKSQEKKFKLIDQYNWLATSRERE